MLGPYFQCGGYGHITKFCSGPNRLYPFSQPVVSSAVVHEPSPGLKELSLCCESVMGVIAKSTTHSVCVNELLVLTRLCQKVLMDNLMSMQVMTRVCLTIK